MADSSTWRSVQKMAKALYKFPRKRLACLRSRTVRAVRRPSRTGSSWRPWSNTGTRTASSVPAATVASGRWDPPSSPRPTSSSVGGTISDCLEQLDTAQLAPKWFPHLKWSWGPKVTSTTWSVLPASSVITGSVWETSFIYVTIKYCVNMTMKREWFLPTWHAAITRCPRSRNRLRASAMISLVDTEVPALIHYRDGELWPLPTPPYSPHLPLYRIWHFTHWTHCGTDLHGFILLYFMHLSSCPHGYKWSDISVTEVKRDNSVLLYCQCYNSGEKFRSLRVNHKKP